MDFMNFLVQQGIIIAAALYVVGIFLKKAPFMPDWLIPFILTVLGVAAAGFSMSGGFTVENILQGVFAAGAAVLTNQLQKQGSVQNVGDAFAAKAANNDITHTEDDGDSTDDDDREVS